MKSAVLMGNDHAGNLVFHLFKNGGDVFVAAIYDNCLNRTTFIQTHHDGKHIDGTAYRIIYGDSITDCLKEWGFDKIEHRLQDIPGPTLDKKQDNKTWEQKAKEKQNKIWEYMCR